MKPSKRKLKKWRKDKPMVSRSYAEKRGRKDKHIEKEMRDSKDEN
jgi:hypothetical protein